MATRGGDRARNGGSAAGKRNRARARPAGLDPGGVARRASAPGRSCLLRRRRARPRAVGADFVPLYRTRELRPQPPPQGDLVGLASCSAESAFGALAAEDDARTTR